MAQGRLTRFEQLALGLVVAGVALRLMHFVYGYLADDGAWYATMAESLRRHGEFLVPWADPVRYTQHYPPVYPAFLAGFFALFGTTLTAIAIANLVAFVLLVLVALFTTWDLYGRARGFAVAAVVACLPALVRFDRLGLSESLVAAAFAVTIWAILRSLTDARFILLAGLFAAIGYLTKASMGPFFVLAGLAGLGWRFYYVRWRVFRDPWYLGAAALFVAAVLAWAYRNVLRHGWPNWETQPYATEAVRYLFGQSPWWLIIAQSIFAALYTLLLLSLPWLTGMASAWKDVRAERTSALWMAVVTPTVVAALFMAAFAANEKFEILRSNLAIRYVITPIVPLLWLGMRGLDLDEPERPAGEPTEGARLMRMRAGFALAGVAVLFLAFALEPDYQARSKARTLIPPFMIAVGFVLLFLARVYHWTTSERVAKDGTRTWRVVGAPAPGNGLVAVVLVLVGFGMSALLFPDGLVLFVAGGAAFLLPNDRERALGVAAILLGASLFGAGAQMPLDAVGEDLQALAKEGDTLAVTGGKEFFFWPFVGDRVAMVSEDRDPTYVVEWVPQGNASRENYTLVREYQAVMSYAPGSAASLAIERALGVHVSPPPIVGARLWVKDGTVAG